MLSNNVCSDVLSNSPDVLVDEYERYCTRIRGLAIETVREQRTYLDRFTAWSACQSSRELIAGLSAVVLRRFCIEYSRTHGPGSLRWMQVTLRSFLQFCYYYEYLSVDLSCVVPSCRKGPAKRLPKYMPERDTRHLLASIDRDHSPGLRDFAIIVTALTYGVRGIQLRRLRLNDIQWAREEIFFPSAKQGQALHFPLNAQVGNALADYIWCERNNTSQYPEVFLTTRSPFHPFRGSGSFSAIVSRRLQQAGIQPPEGVSHGLYGFRHAFASRLTGEVPFKHIADLMGHQDMDSTFTYTNLDADRMAETALPWPEEVQS